MAKGKRMKYLGSKKGNNTQLTYIKVGYFGRVA